MKHAGTSKAYKKDKVTLEQYKQYYRGTKKAIPKKIGFSIIEDKDILKPIIAVFPKYAKDMIINIVNANTEINHFIAQHIIDTSNVEYKEITKMVNQSVDNKQDNKFKNISDDEIYAEIKRRKANKSAK